MLVMCQEGCDNDTARFYPLLCHGKHDDVGIFFLPLESEKGLPPHFMPGSFSLVCNFTVHWNLMGFLYVG